MHMVLVKSTGNDDGKDYNDGNVIITLAVVNSNGYAVRAPGSINGNGKSIDRGNVVFAMASLPSPLPLPVVSFITK